MIPKRGRSPELIWVLQTLLSIPSNVYKGIILTRINRYIRTSQFIPVISYSLKIVFEYNLIVVPNVQRKKKF